MPQVTEEYRRQRRAQLLDAAKRCFVRQGFHATSMKDVLSEAGMSAGAAYGYFSSKDEIILAVAEENMGQVAAALQAMSDDAAHHTPASALAQILRLISQRTETDDFAKVTVIVWSEAIRNPALRTRLLALADQYRETFSTLWSADEPSVSSASRAIGAIATMAVTGHILQLALGEPVAVNEFLEPLFAGLGSQLGASRGDIPSAAGHP